MFEQDHLIKLLKTGVNSRRNFISRMSALGITGAVGGPVGTYMKTREALASTPK